jgi:hypothetical protein
VAAYLIRTAMKKLCVKIVTLGFFKVKKKDLGSSAAVPAKG